MRRGILRQRQSTYGDRQMVFTLNPDVREAEEKQELLEQLVGKPIAVTFETTLYLFEVAQAFYEDEELRAIAKDNHVRVISMLAPNWQEPLKQRLVNGKLEWVYSEPGQEEDH